MYLYGLISWFVLSHTAGHASSMISSSLPSMTKVTSSHHHHHTIPPLKSEAPLKVLLLVEPTPFNYVSGYANRFKEMLKYLHLAGDEVKVVTADRDPHPPTSYLSYPIKNQRGNIIIPSSTIFIPTSNAASPLIMSYQ